MLTTERGEVTIPAQVRRRLGVGPGDAVVFMIDDDGAVGLTAPGFTLEDAFGSVRPAGTVVDDDFKSATREAKQEKAERTLRKMGLR